MARQFLTLLCLWGIAKIGQFFTLFCMLPCKALSLRRKSCFGWAVFFLGLAAAGMAEAQGPGTNLGRVVGYYLCTEAGVMGVLQATSKSQAATRTAMAGPGCARSRNPGPYQIIRIVSGPVRDFEGDDAYAVEVWAIPPDLPHRFIIAWPGVNAVFDPVSGVVSGQDS